MDNQPNGITPDTQSPESTPSTSQPSTASMPQATPTVNVKHAHKFIIGYVSLIILVAATSGVYSWQHKKLNNANAKIANLQTQLSSSQSQVTKLSKQLDSTASNTKTYTDPSKIYSVSYPSSWIVYQASGQGAQTPAPVIDKQAVTFTPPDSPKIGPNESNAIDISAYQSSDASAILKFNQSGNSNTSPQSLTINGYPALYQQFIESGSSSSTTYTDDWYVVTHNGVTIAFWFRDKQDAVTYPATPQNNTPAFDDSSIVPAFTTFVKSVKFLN